MPLATLSFSITIYDENAIIPLQYSLEIVNNILVELICLNSSIINRGILTSLRIAQPCTLSVLIPNSETQTVALYGRIAA